jgi:hypothetical protein
MNRRRDVRDVSGRHGMSERLLRLHAGQLSRRLLPEQSVCRGDVRPGLRHGRDDLCRLSRRSGMPEPGLRLHAGELSVGLLPWPRRLTARAR